MIKKIILVLLLTSISHAGMAQTVLDDYIQVGLENNLALKQKDFSYRKSITSLKEARGLFLPSISINARYTRSDGGRIIEFPVGDLMNPVYQSLNQLTGQNLFPAIKNEKIKFLREKEHDTKFEIIQPLFQPEIYYNYKIKSNLLEMERAERNSFARVLICDIKTAYYNYLITAGVTSILNATENILNENLRVSRSLFNNDKATIDIVYRAEAELSRLKQEQVRAASDCKTAGAYFNFLLNRSLEDPIVVDTNVIQYTISNMSLEKAIDLAIKRREELNQINYAYEAAENNITLNKSKFLPNILLAANYGYEGEEYSFGKNDDYWTASLVMQWNLFRGFQDKLKVEQAEYDRKNLELRKLELENQIRLQVRSTYYNYEVAQKSIETAIAQKLSSQKSFEIINKKFNEGMASQIEFIDARTTLTNAELNNTISKYQELISLAELEKVIAANPTTYKISEVK